MSTISRSRLKLLLGVGALLGVALFSQPKSASALPPGEGGVCTEAYMGGGVYRVTCGSYSYCYQNNVYSGPC